MLIKKRGIGPIIALSIIMCLLTGLVYVYGSTGGTPVADPAASAGTVQKVTVTFYGNTCTSKGFTWYTSKASTGSDLQVNTFNDFTNPSMTFTGRCEIPSNTVNKTSSNKYNPPEFLHKAEATGLSPGTVYYFRVGDASLGLWSNVGTFETAPLTGPFTFIDIADTQAKSLDESLLSANNIKKALTTIPDTAFVALNGDWVDKGNNENEWNALFGYAPEVFQNNTFVAAPGNHEEQSGTFIDHFDIKPAAGSDVTTGAYYSFDYSNAHFITLNNNENSTTYNDFSVAQVDWLKADVAAAKANGSVWNIVVMHKGPYTTSNHATDSDIMGPAGVRTLIAPIFADLGVDLVLQGHDHIFARSRPIKADNTAAAENIITEVVNGQNIQYQINNDGTVYLVPNTAGPKVYYKNKTIDPTFFNLFDIADEHHAAVYGPDPSDVTRPARSMVENFTSISINGKRLTAVTYEIDNGGLIHSNSVPYVIDTFGLLKDNAPPEISVGGISDGDTFKLNQQVKVTWSVSDDNSGVKTSSGDIASGAMADTTKLGQHELRFSAVDYAGNITEKVIKYNVVYSFSGVLEPLNLKDGNTVRGGAVPVKFTLKDVSGAFVSDAVCRLYISKIENGMPGLEKNAISVSSPKQDNLFRYDTTGNQYIFNLNIKGLSGKYQLRIDTGDCTLNTVIITVQ